MSLQERTLVIKNFVPEKTTTALLKELCLQGGPVKNVVVKPDHAFVEYEDKESVGYAKALFDGVELFGRKLVMEPKLRNDQSYYKYSQNLIEYVNYDRRCRSEQQQQQLLQQQQNPFINYQQQPVQLPPVNYQMPIVPQQELTPPTNNSFGPSTSSSSRGNNSQWGRNDNPRRSQSFNHNQQKRGKWDRRR